LKLFTDIVKPETRQYLYRIVLVVAGILGTTGVITEELLPLITALAAAVLAVAVADGNVNKAPAPPAPPAPADPPITVEVVLPQIEESLKQSAGRHVADPPASTQTSKFTD
jgi:hypothetical protein